MQCINCKSMNTRAINSREARGVRRRRYKCLECGERFSTLEGYEGIALFNDGTWLSKDHLIMVAKQLAEGSAELAALAKLFGRKEG